MTILLSALLGQKTNHGRRILWDLCTDEPPAVQVELKQPGGTERGPVGQSGDPSGAENRRQGGEQVRDPAGHSSSRKTRVLGRAASPCQGPTCGADDGFIHHTAILVDADTNPLIKSTVIALHQTSRSLHLLW